MDSTSREAGSARRVAWVAWTLAAAAVAGFLFAATEAHRVDARVAEQLARAEQYLREHPYLEPPPLLERHVDLRALGELRAEYEARRERRAAPPIPPRIQAREQRELDARTATAGAGLEGLVPRRLGLRASGGSAAAYGTHLFFHGSWLHLMGCVFLVLFVGHFVEGTWGSALFAGIATASALGGAVAYTAGSRGLDEPFIGMTGVAAGLLGAFAVCFGDRRDRGPFFAVLLLGAGILLLPGWLGLEWAVARGPLAPPPRAGGWNPSLWAVVGGFGAGTLAACAARLLGLTGRARAGSAPAVGRSGPSPQLARALQERSAGRAQEAFRLLSTLVQREPDALDACEVFWEVAHDVGRPAGAVASILRVLRDEVQRGDAARAVRHWLELEASGLESEAEPALLLRMAPLLRDAREIRSATRALAAALARSRGRDGAAVAVRVARDALDLDEPLAARAAWAALGSTEIDLQERHELETLLAALTPRLPPDDDEQPAAPPHAAALSAADADASTGSVPPAHGAIEFDESQRKLALMLAVPIELDSEGLRIEVADGSKKRVRFDRIEAVAVAAVDGLGERTVIVVDLVLNWVSLTAETLQVVRLRGDRFDPRALAPGASEPLDALRAFVEGLLDRSRGIPLPDLQSVRGQPFAAFPSVAAYHRTVLLVD